MKLPLTALFSLFLASLLLAAPGKIVLTNGRTLAGDLEKTSDGGYRVTVKSGSITFDRSEIQKCTIFSTRDPARESFVASLRITPGGRSPKRATATPYDHLIQQAAKKHQMDPALVKAVIKAESNFNPDDTSRKGASGLMQLMPETARLLGVKSIYSPQENILGGTRYLKDMMYTFDGDIDKALAAYNAGPGAVKKYNSIPPFRETKQYIKNVRRYYNDYKGTARLKSYVDENGCLNISN